MSISSNCVLTVINASAAVTLLEQRPEKNSGSERDSNPRPLRCQCSALCSFCYTFCNFFFVIKIDHCRLGHFQVVLCLCARKSLLTNLFIRKSVPTRDFFPCMSNSFNMKCFARGLVLKQNHKVAHKCGHGLPGSQ